MKSPNIISRIGLKPLIAKPVAKPVILASLIGVVSTLSGKLVESPFVTLKAPPEIANNWKDGH